MRQIVFDTETTGLDPATGHRIIELGCVELRDRIPTGHTFQRYLNPERDVPPEAQAVHGITTAFLLDKPLFSEVVEDFLDFIADSPLVIHNAGFDLKFLNHELGRLGFAALPSSRAIDTVEIARRRFPGAPANLDALCRRFSIDLSARTAHGALLDAQLLAEVYLELEGGRQALIPLVAAVRKETDAQNMQDIPHRRFPASTGEQEAHREFLKKLRNPLWAKILEEVE